MVLKMVMVEVVNTVGVMGEEEMEEVGRREFEEDQEQVERALAELEAWVAASPHLSKIKANRFNLWSFYRGCHHDMEKTKAKLDLHFTMRGLLPEWWGGWDPRTEELERIIHAGVFLPLRGFDSQGRYVLLIRVGKVDPALMTTNDCYKTMCMIFSMAQENNRQYWTRGYVLLVDHEGAGVRHALMTGPEVLRKHKVVFQDCYPMESEVLIDKSKQLIINMPTVFQAILNTFLALLDRKFLDMIKVIPSSGTKDALKECMGEAVLPSEYGGTNGTVEDHRIFWKEEVRKQREWLMEQQNFRTAEHLRPGGPKKSEDVFGSPSCSIM